jgi:hypothetical protein
MPGWVEKTRTLASQDATRLFRSVTAVEPDVLVDILGCLQRLDIDSCRLVSSVWSHVVADSSAHIPLHNVGYCRVRGYLC